MKKAINPVYTLLWLLFMLSLPFIGIFIIQNYYNPIVAIPYSISILFMAFFSIQVIDFALSFPYRLKGDFIKDLNSNKGHMIFIGAFYALIGSMISEFFYAFNFLSMGNFELKYIFPLITLGLSILFFLRITYRLQKTLEFYRRILLDIIFAFFFIGITGTAIFSISFKPPLISLDGLLIISSLYGVIFSVMDFVVCRFVAKHSKEIESISSLFDTLKEEFEKFYK